MIIEFIYLKFIDLIHTESLNDQKEDARLIVFQKYYSILVIMSITKSNCFFDGYRKILVYRKNIDTHFDGMSLPTILAKSLINIFTRVMKNQIMRSFDCESFETNPDYRNDWIDVVDQQLFHSELLVVAHFDNDDLKESSFNDIIGLYSSLYAIEEDLDGTKRRQQTEEDKSPSSPQPHDGNGDDTGDDLNILTDDEGDVLDHLSSNTKDFEDDESIE